MIPVLYQQPADAFKRQAEKLNAIFSPAKWFISTNRVAYAKETFYADQAKVLKADVAALKAISPSSEQIALATDFDARGGLLPKGITLTTTRGAAYFERDNWPLMAFVPIDEPKREYWMFRAYMIKKMTPQAGVIYWTFGNNYDCLEDVARMSKQRW